MEERSLIQSQLTLGFKPSWIALSLGRPISTIIRELKRNTWVNTTGVVMRGRSAIAVKYRAVLAQDRANAFLLHNE
jgi:IS30 family transposase